MPADLPVDLNNSGQLEVGWIDRVILAMAERQHGVVARQQLVRAGVPGHVIDYKVGLCRLCPLHRGVYAVGHLRLTREGKWMGAVLAAGEGAVLSHRSAAALWGLGHFDQIEVTAKTHRGPPAIQVHASSLPPDEVTTERGIPVTKVSRTLLDLAALLPVHRVERAMNEAEIRRHPDDLSLADLVARYPGRRGVRTIKSLVLTDPSFTRSELEALFIAFVREKGLPAPRMNASLLGFECDCVWPDQRLVVELDGHEAHRTRAAFERDRARDRALSAGGWRTVRITWRQLHGEPKALALDLRKILRGARRGPTRAAGP